MNQLTFFLPCKVVIEICKKIFGLLLFSVLVVIIGAHITMTYLLNAPDKDGVDNFLNYGQSFNNFWSGLLGDFSAF